MLLQFLLIPLLSSAYVSACSSCSDPTNEVLHKRLVRRMQPDALNATTKPRGPLEWGQINFLHTTDTHGWLQGHLKERNYGADWGDFVSFVKHMRRKAERLKVDLLLVDTGDLHDGAGLSDVTEPNGVVSNAIFSNIDYDLLAIGNHELYETAVAYENFSNFSKIYGERYLTSNVQIINKATGEFEDMGHKFRYFTTKHGLRIMAFGVLFDFTGHSNVSKVTKAEDMVKEVWFQDAVNYPEPIDLFVVIGHNPVTTNVPSSTFGLLHSTIRKMRPDVPIQAFGGHTHIRDFVVYDEMATGLESGQYCETLGWLALTGIMSNTFRGSMNPHGVPNPIKKAEVKGTERARSSRRRLLPRPRMDLRYARRYLDWNRLTFAYHATKSQDRTFDTPKGQTVTNDITKFRSDLNISKVYGCVPRTYCESCRPFGDEGNIFTLLETALAETVVNPSRADIPRLIIVNTGSIRFDLVQGPFTLDDSFTVSPFKDTFRFIPDVPYSQASQVLDILNAGPYQKRSMETDEALRPRGWDVCTDPLYTSFTEAKRHVSYSGDMTRRHELRVLIPGYTTVDDFGTDGDDTPHSKIPQYEHPNDVQANGSFPTDGSMPDKVDFVFLNFIAVNYVLPALASVGAKYTEKDIQYYMPKDFTTNSYLQVYAAKNWQEGLPNCPVGEGVG
ncbi:hypothetical protein AJ80_00099 [Polytolypa hystricis UAMH7299]|uniref:Uncharacterized protein n=1 Tax=Polytolypa hystricis (strain UAMH7299) TaxID=1447883 RepID=A0A2B7Z4N2_POLH7|nr:hypothetical protein AJ80_00099 [Polytolypa hystricis UAMH7299]